MSKQSIMKTIIKNKVDPKIAVAITVLAILIVSSFVIATIVPSFRLGGFSLTQTNDCTVVNVHFDEPGWTAPEKFSLKIYPPAGCAKPYGNAANVNITTTGSYVCSGGARYYNTDVKINSDSVEFTAKCSLWPHYIETSNHFITVKFGTDGSSGTTQYYCNRSDPVKPWCQPGYPGQPGLVSYPQCMASCVPSRNWVDISINPKQEKYQTGQIIKFLPQSNILSRLTKFSWNFDDNISRPNEPYREQPVVYSVPGRKNITLSVIDPQTNETIATTTQIRVKCVPPSNAVPGDELITITSYLNNNYPVHIAANSFRQWVADNKSEVNSYLINQQYCENVGELEVAISFPVVLDYLNKYAGKKISSPLVLVLNKMDGKLGFHTVIALSFKNLNGLSGSRALYELKYLDPEGPKITTTSCYQRQEQNPAIPGQFIKVIYCDYTFSDTALTTKVALLNPLVGLTHVTDIDTLLQKTVRSNTNSFLINDYPLIDNREPIFKGGVCSAWTDFVLKVAYLGDFAGECASF